MSGTSTGTSTPVTLSGVQNGKKTRSWFVTFWKKEYLQTELPEKAQYLIQCEDRTQAGQWHGHAFIYWKNARVWGACKELFGNDCHVEPAKINSRCIAYCKGLITHDEDPDAATVKFNIKEFGLEPMDNGVKRTIGELKKMDTWDDGDPHLYRIWKEIRRDERGKETLFKMLDQIRNDNLTAPSIIYVHGKSGVGKTYYAYKHACIEYPNQLIGCIKFDQNGFATIINETAKCFVIEEFRDSCITAQEFLQLTDKYIRTLNVKGGHAVLDFEKLYICSIIPITDLYKKAGEVNVQFRRRVTMYHEMTSKEEQETPLDFDLEKLYSKFPVIG